MANYFISDLHLGHYNIIIKHDKRPFKDCEEMDKVIIKKWNAKVTDSDTVYILGDLTWYKEDKICEILNKLNGKKVLIKGNHDKIGSNLRKCFLEIKDYDEIYEDGRKVVLSHYPILFYNGQYRDAVMLYGHIHNNKDAEICKEFIQILNDRGIPCLAFNVGCMHLNYEPCTLKEILSK